MSTTKVNRTKIQLTDKDPLQQSGDFLINWTTPKLNSGDELFLQLHSEGGSPLWHDCQRVLSHIEQTQVDKQREPMLDPGRVAATQAGALKYRAVLHCVVPNFRDLQQDQNKFQLFERLVRQIFHSLDEYNANIETIDTVTFTPIPEMIFGHDQYPEIAKYLVDQIFKNVESRSYLYSTILACPDKTQYTKHSEQYQASRKHESYSLYKSYFDKHASSNWLERLITKIFKL